MSMSAKLKVLSCSGNASEKGASLENNVVGAAGRIRTDDLLVNSQLLYLTELQRLNVFSGAVNLKTYYNI
jgi:hypothetical protein